VREFVPGLTLCGWFYRELVAPILASEFPGLRYSAALIGDGSEVLGFDTEMSCDHDWGPRVLLFLEESDHGRCAAALHETLCRTLPQEFRGYAVDFARSAPKPGETAGAPPSHGVGIFTIAGFVAGFLSFDVRREIEPADWLTFPAQKLRAITGGAVYHDGIGLQELRDRFAYYPHDVWLYLLAAGWTRIGQEQHLMGRAGFVGDEVGSALIGSRLVRDVMRLCFLIERQYAPYPKWFGTAFARLACARDLLPLLRRAQLAETWPERERDLAAAYEYVAAMQNRLGVADPLPARIDSFHDRPFRVLAFDGIEEALRARIRDPVVRRIAAQRLIGSLDQFSDSTDLLAHSRWRPALRRLYGPEAS
jgi:Domain of unknown function (DUF4037)